MTDRAYYNETNPYAAEWLRYLIYEGLIAPGDVDERSIADVSASDLAAYAQCHFFAGLGGWSLALRMAGWPDAKSVWTGSCPCQPFSQMGRRKGFDDERHLWPAWLGLIAMRRPPVVFGEQSARAADWLRLVRGDLVALDYAVGAMPIEAASAGAPHLRDRFWFVAHPARGEGRPHGAHLPRQGERKVARQAEEWGPRGPGGRSGAAGNAGRGNEWPAEPCVGRVAHGISAGVDQLRALGNAIVPALGAQWIGAFMEYEASWATTG